MWRGSILSINIAQQAGGSMQSVGEIRAVPGKGLEGDRYFVQSGSMPRKQGPDREVTLIEIEAIEALKHENEILLPAGNARRNLVTRGVPLNHLVGKKFKVGEVTLRGVRLCEPCGHLAEMTQPEVRSSLVHRGGLRAEIVTGGIIHVGDVVEE